MYKKIFCFLFPIFLLASCTSTMNIEENKQKSFEWVFGDLVKLSPDMVRQVVSSKIGQRHYIDRNNDGKKEEVWFIDTDIRHTEERNPILVRAIDRDNDMQEGGEPDLDSDIYIVDWHADGTVDAVLEYEDIDGDQDVDFMYMYFYDEKYGLRAWWCRDDGDDNLLWYNVDYAYFQELCEVKTHFGGDESFACMYINPGDDHWTPFLENPFFFYDEDGDGITEEVLRFVGDNNNIRSIRWSFDADNDATQESPRDYDVSITALAANYHVTDPDHNIKNTNLFYKEDESEMILVHGFPVKILKRSIARSFAQKQTWAQVLMTWDENDLNSAYRVKGNTYERWEGVIASASTEPGYEMIRVGWPDCGPVNKRYEIMMQPEGPNEYYYSPGDYRIHLKNSDKAWLKVDYDYDTKVDMMYEWLDKNKDGIKDHIVLDVDGDGVFDDTWSLDTSITNKIEWTFEDIYKFRAHIIENYPQQFYYLNKALIKALQKRETNFENDCVWSMIEHRMICDSLDLDQSNRLIQSNESVLYYLNLAADRHIYKLKKTYNNSAFWMMFDEARGTGNIKKMTEIINKEFNIRPEVTIYTSWLNSLREEPQQRLVAWNENWVPPNIGWESEKVAFRCYDGHFDIFCKRMDTLIYPKIATGASYHKDINGWGMDILHVNQRGGIGGLILYVNGESYPLRNEKRPNDPIFSGRLFKETKDEVIIELKVDGIGPEKSPYSAQILASARAGKDDSQMDVRIIGGDQNDDIMLGIVLPTLFQETFFVNKQTGVMGVWGFQDPSIGWIGLGVIFPSDRFLYIDSQLDEYSAVLKYNLGETIRYYIQGDWLRGHRFGPTGGSKDWQRTLERKASSINR